MPATPPVKLLINQLFNPSGASIFKFLWYHSAYDLKINFIKNLENPAKR